MNDNTNNTSPFIGQNGGQIQQAMDTANTAKLAQQQQQSTVTPQTADSGNWFTHLLPTIGAIGAPILAGLGTGGLGLFGGAAASGAGGAFGQSLENILEGKNPIDNNVVESGVVNAGAGLAGGLLGKIGAKFAANTAAPALENAGSSLLAGQGAGALTKEDAAYLFKNGITNLKQMDQIAPLITGSEGALNSAVENSLLNANEKGLALDLSSLAKVSKNVPSAAVTDAARQAGIAGDSNAIKGVQDFVQGQLEKYNPVSTIPSKGGAIAMFDNGVLNSQEPINALNMTRNMDKAAGDWMRSSSPTIQAQGKALSNVSNVVKDSLYGPDTAIGKIGITDQVRQQAIADLEPVKAINPTYYQAKVNEINQASTLGDLRTSQAPDVRASIATTKAQKLDNVSGGTTLGSALKVGAPVVGMSVGGVPGLAAGLVLPKALESGVANTGATALLSKLSAAAGSQTAQKVIPLLSRIAATTAANIPTMGAGAVPVTDQPITGGNMNSGVPIPGMNGVTAMQPSAATTPYDQLVSAMQAQSILAPQMAGQSGAGSFLAGIAPKLQAKQTLESMLGNMQTGFANAGGAQGLGGIGSVLAGMVPGTAQNAYQQQREAVAAQIANAMGISKEEAMNMLPQFMQDQNTASQRMQGLGGVLSSLAG